MLIAGGVYLETCTTPDTRMLMGSGGRAALALSSLRRGIVLHTFHPPSLRSDLEANFAPYGIECVVHPSGERVEFSYLFPLDRPIQIPSRPSERHSRVVEGNEVLCFGCVEGEFEVRSRMAVFDPQGGAFALRGVGDGVERLALVLNLGEALASTGADDAGLAAADMLRRDRTELVIVKDGPRGARVFTRGKVEHVPAYSSRANFKIGSGDVFSAAFAHYWFEGLEPAAAADLASRQTADYVDSATLPLSCRPTSGTPRFSAGNRPILLVLPNGTIAEKWFAQIAAAALERLAGSDVEIVSIMRALADGTGIIGRDAAVVVCPGDVAGLVELSSREALRRPGVTFYLPDPGAGEIDLGGAALVSDLSQALYEACWAPA